MHTHSPAHSRPFTHTQGPQRRTGRSQGGKRRHISRDDVGPSSPPPPHLTSIADMVALGQSSPAARAPTVARYSSSLLAHLLLTFALFSSLLVTSSLAARTKATVVEGSEAILPMKKHSLYAPYVESNLQNKYWDFGGDAIVDTNRHIRLTQDKPHQAGHLWSRLPIGNDNYEIEFEFRIDGKAGVTFGDGMAVWLTDERAQTGPVFGSKDRFRGLGIFFDTYANARHVSSRGSREKSSELKGRLKWLIQLSTPPVM